MSRSRKSWVTRLGDVVRATLKLAQATVYADRVALYIVGLNDPSGFALAAAVHAKISGPDPALLRTRAMQAGVRVPLMVGSAPVQTLARIVEALGEAEPDDRSLLTWSIREIHARGCVPVLVVDEGVAVASTFEAWAETDELADLWGWAPPTTAKA